MDESMVMVCMQIITKRKIFLHRGHSESKKG